MTKRTSTTPGLGASQFPPDEEPTNPGGSVAARAYHRISWQANSQREAEDLDMIVKAWLRMPIEDRVLVTALVRRLDPLG